MLTDTIDGRYFKIKFWRATKLKLFKLSFVIVVLNILLAVTANAKMIITKETMRNCGLSTTSLDSFKECCFKDAIIYSDAQDENSNYNELNPSKDACNQACKGHNFCYWDEATQNCLIKSMQERELEDFYASFISMAEPHWDTNTNSFKCKVYYYLADEYKEELEQYAWHWNPDIAACSYTIEELEYLTTIKQKSYFYNTVKKRNAPWPHNQYYDHSKDKAYCKNLNSSCKYEFIYHGIPECKCETNTKKLHWVYGRRVCEWCEKKNNEFECINNFDSETTHYLEECLDTLLINHQVMVTF